MKTPQQATDKYGTNGGSLATQTLWAADYVANMPSIFTAAAAAVPLWQAAVATQDAANRFVAGLNRAKQNTTAIALKVNTVGKASYSAGVKAAAAVGGNYSTFSAKWMPAVAQEVSTLNISNPRGDRAANRQRQAVYDAWVDTQAGDFRVG